MSETETMKKVKVLTTMQLTVFNRHSTQKKQNRTLTSKLIDALDPEGFHVIGFEMPHTNYEGTEGMRCQILCKLTDRELPVEVWLDINWSDYKTIKTVDVPAKQKQEA